MVRLAAESTGMLRPCSQTSWMAQHCEGAPSPPPPSPPPPLRASLSLAPVHRVPWPPCAGSSLASIPQWTNSCIELKPLPPSSVFILFPFLICFFLLFFFTWVSWACSLSTGSSERDGAGSRGQGKSLDPPDIDAGAGEVARQAPAPHGSPTARSSQKNKKTPTCHQLLTVVQQPAACC